CLYVCAPPSSSHRAVRIQRHDLSIDDAIGKARRGARDRLELPGPVEPLARPERSLALLDSELHLIAVELRFVRPPGVVRRTLDELAKLRLDELGKSPLGLAAGLRSRL